MRYPDRPPYDPTVIERIVVEAGAPTTAETLAEIGAICAHIKAEEAVKPLRPAPLPSTMPASKSVAPVNPRHRRRSGRRRPKKVR